MDDNDAEATENLLIIPKTKNRKYAYYNRSAISILIMYKAKWWFPEILLSKASGCI